MYAQLLYSQNQTIGLASVQQANTTHHVTASYHSAMGHTSSMSISDGFALPSTVENQNVNDKTYKFQYLTRTTQVLYVKHAGVSNNNISVSVFITVTDQICS